MEFTLITVTLNAEATLERTLCSVEQQTCRNFQHIIMDGVSSDGTLRIARDYARRNEGLAIEVVSEPDHGLYHAMNKALQRAAGDYVVFLNAGDKLHAPDTLERLSHCVASRPAVVYGDTDIVDREGHFLRHRRLSAPERLGWRSFRQGMLVCHQSFYVRRDLAPEYDLRYRFSADVDWCIRVLRAADERGEPLVNAHRVLTDYLQEGMTTRNHKASLRERFRIMAHHYGWPETLALHAWFAIRALVKR